MLYRYSSVAQSLDISESSEGAQQFGIAWVLHVLHRAQNMDFRPSSILLDDVTWKLVVGVPTSLTGSLQTISSQTRIDQDKLLDFTVELFEDDGS